MTRNGTITDPHGLQQLAEYIGENLYDIIIPMRKIADVSETYAVELSFQVQSVNVLVALEDRFIQHGASVLASRIKATETEDGSIVRSMELCSPLDQRDNITDRVRIRISHVQPGKRD